MYDRAIMKIQRYMDEQLPELDITHPKYEFDIRSHARWAANEIIERLIREDSKLPSHITGKEPISELDIIQEFIDETEYCSYVKTDPDLQRMFNIAYNTATYIKCLFL